MPSIRWSPGSMPVTRRSSRRNTPSPGWWEVAQTHGSLIRGQIAAMKARRARGEKPVARIVSFAPRPANPPQRARRGASACHHPHPDCRGQPHSRPAVEIGQPPRWPGRHGRVRCHRAGGARGDAGPTAHRVFRRPTAGAARTGRIPSGGLVVFRVPPRPGRPSAGTDSVRSSPRSKAGPCSGFCSLPRSFRNGRRPAMSP